jgi:hypothetical protein
MQSTLGSFFKVKGQSSAASNTIKSKQNATSRAITPATTKKKGAGGKSKGTLSASSEGLKSLTSFWQPSTNVNTTISPKDGKENEKDEDIIDKKGNRPFPPSQEPQVPAQMNVENSNITSDAEFEKHDNAAPKDTIEIHSDEDLEEEGVDSDEHDDDYSDSEGEESATGPLSTSGATSAITKSTRSTTALKQAPTNKRRRENKVKGEC